MGVSYPIISSTLLAVSNRGACIGRSVVRLWYPYVTDPCLWWADCVTNRAPSSLGSCERIIHSSSLLRWSYVVAVCIRKQAEKAERCETFFPLFHFFFFFFFERKEGNKLSYFSRNGFLNVFKNVREILARHIKRRKRKRRIKEKGK